MTKEEAKQMKKSTALNAIRKLYHPKYELPKRSIGFYHGEYESDAERRDEMIREIIEQLELDLKAKK